MRAIIASAFVVFAFTGMASVTARAQDALTATCKDGTTWSGAHRGGACRGHKGVQAFGAAGSTAAPVAAATPATPPAAATSEPAAPAAPVATAKPARPNLATTPAAPGGGPGEVWVNASTKVYHCQGDRYYGKTKTGSYMTEVVAKAAGDHAAKGKACS